MDDDTYFLETVADLRARADGFDPRESAVAGVRTAEVSRDGLLARRAVLLNGTWFTVADAIRYVSHVEGGIHRGAPDDEQQQALAASPIGIGGHASTATWPLRGIARVVARGLEPLEEAIRAERAGSHFDHTRPETGRHRPSR